MEETDEIMGKIASRRLNIRVKHQKLGEVARTAKVRRTAMKAFVICERKTKTISLTRKKNNNQKLVPVEFSCLSPISMCEFGVACRNKNQCSRQLQCEVPCGVGNVINSSLFIKSSLSSLSSTSHAVHRGGLATGGQGIFQSSCHILHHHMVLCPKGTSHNQSGLTHDNHTHTSFPDFGQLAGLLHVNWTRDLLCLLQVFALHFEGV